jgi:predicted GIY-YIG superfamily endonuclease
MIGIYIIEHTKTKKAYVGMSGNISKRFREHLNNLEKQKHHSKKLQNAYNESDITQFRFRVLELCKAEDLREKEKLWIARYDSIDKGYNVQDPGIAQFKKALKEIAKKRICELILCWFNIFGFGLTSLGGLITVIYDLFHFAKGDMIIPILSEAAFAKLLVWMAFGISVWNVKHHLQELKIIKKKFPIWKIASGETK